MHIPKRYGQSKIDTCPFCQKTATSMNSQKVPVCATHKDEILDNIKCVCGDTLDVLNGKFGVFFSCIKCGNMNLRKVMEFNSIKPKQEIRTQEKNPIQKSNYQTKKTEITVRSDDPRYFD